MRVCADKFISQRLKDYSNPDSNVSMSALNSQVSEVHSVLRKNIQDVLARGGHIDRACQLARLSHYSSGLIGSVHCLCVSADMANISEELRQKSKEFAWGAKRRNLMESMKKYLPCIVVLVLVLLVVYVRFLR